MKKNNYKKIFIILTLLIVYFILPKASFAADVYFSQGQNGSLISTVDILPGTTLDTSTSFKVSGSIFSASTTPETVSLTATNNGSGSPITLIASQSINPNMTLQSGLVGGFSAPNTPGNYAVNFVTNVDINIPTTANLQTPFYLAYAKIAGEAWNPNQQYVCFDMYPNNGIIVGSAPCPTLPNVVVYQYSAVAESDVYDSYFKTTSQQGVVCLDNAISTATILTVKWKDSYDNLQHTFNLNIPAGDRCTSSSNYPPIPPVPSLFPNIPDFNIHWSLGFAPIYLGHTFTAQNSTFTTSEMCVASNNPAVTIPTSLKCN